jgi:hypothetical protein
VAEPALVYASIGGVAAIILALQTVVTTVLDGRCTQIDRRKTGDPKASSYKDAVKDAKHLWKLAAAATATTALLDASVLVPWGRVALGEDLSPGWVFLLPWAGTICACALLIGWGAALSRATYGLSS